MIKEDVQIMWYSTWDIYKCFYFLLFATQYIKLTLYNYGRWKCHKKISKVFEKATLYKYRIYLEWVFW